MSDHAFRSWCALGRERRDVQLNRGTSLRHAQTVNSGGGEVAEVLGGA
jgi:hypothetical protein